MNIKTINAHLKLLSPAPNGKKWKMVRVGEILSAGDTLISSGRKFGPTSREGQVIAPDEYQDKFCARYWRLVPALAWSDSPLNITHDILPTANLRRETVDGIIADFIKTVSDEKTFRAYLKAAKKGLEPHDFD